MRRPRVKYRNNEERIYMKVLLPLRNVLAYQEGILEELEEKHAQLRDLEGGAAVNITTQLMAQRKVVVLTQKLLEAVTSCEPAICREEREI